MHNMLFCPKPWANSKWPPSGCCCASCVSTVDTLQCDSLQENHMCIARALKTAERERDDAEMQAPSVS